MIDFEPLSSKYLKSKNIFNLGFALKLAKILVLIEELTAH
jgi:hypothetical protein